MFLHFLVIPQIIPRLSSFVKINAQQVELLGTCWHCKTARGPQWSTRLEERHTCMFAFTRLRVLGTQQ